MNDNEISLNELLEAWPLQDLAEHHKNYINYWFQYFDYSLLDKVIYSEGWQNYDCSGYTLIFLAIDGSIISMYAESSPFGSSADNAEEDYRYDETSPKQALLNIQNHEDIIKSIAEDSNYAF